MCYQATPNWFELIPDVTPQLLSGVVNSTYVNASKHATPLPAAEVPRPGPTESEDCLFLDVQVPEKTFANKGRGDGAPVIVWVHGGGLVFGSKNDAYDPSGLLAQSVLQTGEEVVYVALNYRVSCKPMVSFNAANQHKLGAFGFSGGPTLQSVDGVSNAGLLDQRFALDWVQKNIKSFGGDPRKVTL